MSPVNRRTVGMPVNESVAGDGPTIYLPAVSVKQPYASLIAQGKKPIETRVWTPLWRGPIVIAASALPVVSGLPTRQALCIANLADCRPMRREDQRAACCEIYARAQAWLFDQVWPITPFAVRGSLGFYKVAVNMAAVIDEDRFTRIAELAKQAWSRMGDRPMAKWMRFA